MIKDQKLKKGLNVEDLPGELWKMHPEGRLISNYGRMKMIYKSKENKGNYRVTLGHLHHSGYRKVHINGKKRYMHRLVLETFTSVEEGFGKVVDHIDRDKLNNKLENLRWATYKDNAINRNSPTPFKHCCTCVCKFE